MKADNESSPEAELMPAEQMSRIGVELVMKATLCAATIALIAGMVAALIGS